MEEEHAIAISNGEVRNSMLCLLKKLNYSDFKSIFEVEETEFPSIKKINTFGFDKFDLVDI